MQGITTEIIGQDELGEAPIRQELVAEWRRYLSGLNGDPPIEWSWEGMEGYLDVLETSETAVNVVSLVGHGNLRLLALGMEDRNPSEKEMEEMKRLLRASLEAGAIGMSTGLIYAPCVYSDTDELTELCKVGAEYDGVFVVHMRDEGDKLLESMDEVLTIARESDAHAHTSHFKAGGKMNWGKSRDALRKLDARACTTCILNLNEAVGKAQGNVKALGLVSLVNSLAEKLLPFFLVEVRGYYVVSHFSSICCVNFERRIHCD